MGEVYRAADPRLGRHVAIKVLPRAFACDAGRLERFEQEARAVAALDHPNIVVVHDVGIHRRCPYLVEELLEGSSLRELLGGSPLAVRRALEYAVQIAHGLDAAHAKGIVHRDLKPDNVFLTSEGRIKILDFGLAKVLDLPTSSELTTAAPGTDPGVVLGTMGYMAPEQLRGQPVDRRADIFALGCVLYEMLSGRRAFSGDAPADVVSAIVSKDPAPLSSLRDEIPPVLERVVGRCLEKRPQDRFSSAHDVALALEVTSGPAVDGAAGRGSGRRPRTRTLLTAGLAAAVLVAALGGARVFWPAPPAPAPELNPKRLVVAPLENRTGDPSLDPVGQMAADAIVAGLAEVGTIEIVPAAGDIVPAGPRPRQDPVRALAEASGAGLVVSGAYYLHGRTLQLRASVTDAIVGKPLRVVEPATTAPEKAVDAVEVLRGRVLDTVAAHCLHPDRDLLIEEVSPPAFDAQKTLAKGFEILATDPSAADALFRRALEQDPSFVSARVALVSALLNEGRLDKSERELDLLERDQARLTPIVRLRTRIFRANIEGRNEEFWSSLRALLDLNPGDRWASWFGFASLWTNRPAEAVRILRSPAVLEGPLIRPAASGGGALYFQVLTAALHLLGEHEQELAEARRGRLIYPDVLNLRACEVRALVALGRQAEVDSLLDEVTASSSRLAYTKCCIPHGTPGLVMQDAAEELRVHGRKEHSLEVASRAAEWYRSRPGEEAGTEETRVNLGSSLYQAERWEEARAGFARLAAEHPRNHDYLGRLGTLAARRGDRAAAERIDERLRRLRQRLEAPEINTFWRARIRAVLGDRTGALTLLREAVAEGAGSSEAELQGYALAFRHRMDLEMLHGDPEFEELLRPKP